MKTQDGAHWAALADNGEHGVMVGPSARKGEDKVWLTLRDLERMVKAVEAHGGK